MPAIEIDPALVERRILDLGAIGAHSGTGVWRTVYSPEWVAAQALVRDWAEAAGLASRMDAVGNLWARSAGQGSAIVSGSHIDSQTPGGRYDGALGVIAALTAIETLLAQYGPPKRPLEMVSLCEEEGSRFPSAGFWGSRAIVGRIAPEDLETVRAEDGTPIGEAMVEVGLDPARAGEARRDDIAAFVELHIEQGPILEAADRPVAVVDAITAIRQLDVCLTGEQNHAGAFPMDLRRDPMAGFAEIAGQVIAHAHRLGRPAVTTVGQVRPWPNMPAVVPREVRFTIDARHPDADRARALYDTHARLIEEVAARRDLELEMAERLFHPAVPSDPALVAALQGAADAQGVPYLTMASGAGHDAQQMARICPVAMVFVRSQDGRSHTPEEFSTLPDIVAGIRTLAAGLHRLAYA